MKTIGILGGGQLARMIALAGAPLGVRFLVVDNVADACAGQVAPQITADWRDFAALQDFAKRIDVATFDFENVPADTAHWLAERVAVFPNPRALATTQDRLVEKTLFRELGLATPAFAAVDSRDDLERALGTIGTPAVLKTRRLGYDGKGQRRVDNLAAPVDESELAEELVAFDRELSIVGVRARNGDLGFWPVGENIHRDGILRLTRAPAAGAPQDEAEAICAAVLEELDHVGVLAVELFDLGGRLLANELAPRVHNTAHWTIDGAETSQFENHLRAILGLPLGPTAARAPCVMVNLIGDVPPLGELLALRGARVHLYGKEPRRGRKVGHVTLVDPEETTVDRLVALAG